MQKFVCPRYKREVFIYGLMTVAGVLSASFGVMYHWNGVEDDDVKRDCATGLLYVLGGLTVFANVAKTLAWMHAPVEQQSPGSRSLLDVTDGDGDEESARMTSTGHAPYDSIPKSAPPSTPTSASTSVCRIDCAKITLIFVPYLLTIAVGYLGQYYVSTDNQTPQANWAFGFSALGAFSGLMAFVTQHAGAQFSYLDNALEGLAFGLANSKDDHGDFTVDTSQLMQGFCSGGAAGYCGGLLLDYWIRPYISYAANNVKDHHLADSKSRARTRVLCHHAVLMGMFAVRGLMMEAVRTILFNAYEGSSRDWTQFGEGLGINCAAGIASASLLGPVAYILEVYGGEQRLDRSNMDADRTNSFATRFAAYLIFAAVGNIIFQVFAPVIERDCDSLVHLPRR